MSTTVKIRRGGKRRVLLEMLVLTCMIFGMVSQEVRADNVSKKKYTMYVGETKKLRISGISEKIQWKTTKKMVLTVSPTGKVAAKRAGKATIIAKAEKKLFKWFIVVKKANSAKRLQIANLEAKRIVKKYVSNDMNTAERAYVLFRWLSENCSWQIHQSAAAYKKNFGNEAYAALILRRAACSGCAKAYTILCKMAGVPVKHINANSWTHQWNEVKINGKWLKVDAYGGTFEDSTGIRRSLLDRDTFNEEGRKEIPVYSFRIDM